MSDYQVLPKSFTKDKAFEAHQALATLHRVLNRWQDYTTKNHPHDPRWVVRDLRATAATLAALADQVEVEIRKAEAAADAEEKAA